MNFSVIGIAAFLVILFTFSTASAGTGYTAVMPDRLLGALNSALTPEDAASVVASEFPDERERASFFISLLGCGDGPWSAHSGFDNLAVEQLNQVSHVALTAALARAGRTPEGIRGAARWIIVEKTGPPPEPEVLGVILRKIVRVGFTHPQKSNREQTVAFLAKLGTPETRVLLRECLEGKFSTLPGSQTDLPASDTTPSEKAQAALVLATRHDVSIIPLVESLLRNATPADESLYRQALALLREAEARPAKQTL